LSSQPWLLWQNPGSGGNTSGMSRGELFVLSSLF
jgi:hypothetical protein